MTDRAEEAQRWDAQFQRIRSAFQQAFVHPDGTIGNASQASYIIALRAGMLTPRQTRAAGALLAADIRKRGTLLSTGFLGTPLALDALADIGEDGLACDLLLRRAFPSWGYMVDHGATTIWERWNGDTGDVAMNSFNHYALGAVCGYLYRRTAGIEPIAPGFAQSRIAPLFDRRIGSAGASVHTVRGLLETRWATIAGGFMLHVKVPANATAHVQLPAGARSIGPGEHSFTIR